MIMKEERELRRAVIHCHFCKKEIVRRLMMPSDDSKQFLDKLATKYIRTINYHAHLHPLRHIQTYVLKYKEPTPEFNG